MPTLYTIVNRGKTAGKNNPPDSTIVLTRVFIAKALVNEAPKWVAPICNKVAGYRGPRRLTVLDVTNGLVGDDPDGYNRSDLKLLVGIPRDIWADSMKQEQVRVEVDRRLMNWLRRRHTQALKAKLEFIEVEVVPDFTLGYVRNFKSGKIEASWGGPFDLKT